MKTTAYLAVPIRLPLENFKEAIRALEFKNFDVSCWDRESTYSPKMLENSQVLVIFNDSWSWELPTGVMKEVKIAIKLRKPIVMLYRRFSDKQWHLYKVNFLGENVIAGISGTSMSSAETVAKSFNLPLPSLDTYKGKSKNSSFEVFESSSTDSLILLLM